MRFSGLLFLIAAIAAGVLSPGTAHACRCIEPKIEQAYRRADLVVVARVEEVDGSDSNVRRARVTVSEAWKSSAPATITFVSGEDCLYDVRAGQKHLLFLYRGDRGTFGTIRCRGNRPLASAMSSLAWLRRHGKRAPIDAVK